MPEIRPVTIESVSLPEIRRIPEVRALPDAPPVTLQLGMPVVELPGCVAVHPDARLNPSLLRDDPGRTGAYCPEGQIPSFRPMDYSPNEFVIIESEVERPSDEGEEEESETSDVPAIPRLPQPNAKRTEGEKEVELPKPFLERAVDGLPPMEAVVTTTTIALVATTSALVAKPLADLILKLIKPTVKKVMKKVSQVRGKPLAVESVLERRLAQRDRNRALRALRRALKP